MNGGDIAAADIETMVGMHNDAVRGNSDNRNESDLQVTSQIEKMRRESIQILNSNDVQTLNSQDTDAQMLPAFYQSVKASKKKPLCDP